ncbi:D-lactate dehydrogenase, partial [Acinetobacter sp. ULE_I080]
LELVNHLGVNLGDTPEEILTKLENNNYQINDVINNASCCASDHRYAHDVKQVDENTPARVNADPTRLYEAAGAAGKVCVFAVRLDSF